jgi:FeS assembly SUF system protein
MRDSCVARDALGAGRRRNGENGMSEDADLKSRPDAPVSTGVVTADHAQLSPEELKAFGDELIAALKTVYDPEIPVDIYELGLIYKVDVADNKDVAVDMTLTAPGCPVAGEMPGMVKSALETVRGIGEITVNMVFDPPWTPERMSEEAKLELNMF